MPMPVRADIALIASAVSALEARVSAMGTAQPNHQDIVKVLAAVETKVDIFIAEFREHRHTTENYRKDNILVVASLNTSVQGLGAAVAAANAKIEELAPIVASHVTRFAEQTGGLKVGRMVWMALGGSAFGSGIIGFLAARLMH